MNECIGNYSRRCSTKSMREFIRSITTQGDVRSWYNEFCTKESSGEREKYLKHATCLNSAQKESRSCMRDLTVALDKAINSDVEKRIPGKRPLFTTSLVHSFEHYCNLPFFAFSRNVLCRPTYAKVLQ